MALTCRQTRAELFTRYRKTKHCICIHDIEKFVLPHGNLDPEITKHWVAKYTILVPWNEDRPSHFGQTGTLDLFPLIQLLGTAPGIEITFEGPEGPFPCPVAYLERLFSRKTHSLRQYVASRPQELTGFELEINSFRHGNGVTSIECLFKLVFSKIYAEPWLRQLCGDEYDDFGEVYFGEEAVAVHCKLGIDDDFVGQHVDVDIEPDSDVAVLKFVYIDEPF